MRSTDFFAQHSVFRFEEFRTLVSNWKALNVKERVVGGGEIPDGEPA